MPVVTFQRSDLCQLIGEEHSSEALGERMPMMGGDLDKIDGEAITIEWFPDRPDLLTLEGTGRALRAFYGITPGMPEYPVAKATTKLTVDESVQAVRPYAALCFVRGVPFDEAYLQTVIDAQEKLTLAPGRKRRKIAIGIHDASSVQGPFTYTCIGDEKPFVPLAETREMTPSQIMAEHPKGIEYAHLLPDGIYPVFLDGNGEVVSLPPVINSAKTTVTAQTQDLLLDVTGTDLASVKQTIALLATGFAERGGTIESVEINDASGKWSSPDLTPTETVIEVARAQKLLGIPLEADEMCGALGKMGHNAEDYGNKILVNTPAWRFDVLHPVDIMEDIAIGYGFENFPGAIPSASTFGGSLPHQDLEDKARSLMLGFGWHEARTITLSNPADQWGKFGDEQRPSVAVRNPVLEEQTILRTRLAPSILNVLAANRHRPLPQRLFEAGYVVTESGTDWKNRLRFAGVEQAGKANFSDLKGLVESLVRDLSLKVNLAPADRPGYIAGRQGKVLAEGVEIGHFGELHPDTIVAFGLGAATVAFEIDLTALA